MIGVGGTSQRGLEDLPPVMPPNPVDLPNPCEMRSLSAAPGRRSRGAWDDTRPTLAVPLILKRLQGYGLQINQVKRSLRQALLGEPADRECKAVDRETDEWVESVQVKFAARAPSF
jgi:hypothetical protein